MSEPDIQANARLEAIWLTVSKIPSGRVSSYGQVSKMAGLPGKARYVGYALGRLDKESTVPWFRVVNAQGRIAFPLESEAFKRQVEQLQAEGVVIQNGRIIHFRQRHWSGEN